MEAEVLLRKGRMWLDEGGIVHAVFARGAELVLADGEDFVAKFDQLRQDRRLGLLLDMRGAAAVDREMGTLAASPR
jgi:hypothetical protein